MEILFKVFVYFTGYEDDIFQGISKLNVQSSKLGKKLKKKKFAENLKKIDPMGFVGFAFSNSEYRSRWLVEDWYNLLFNQAQHFPPH